MKARLIIARHGNTFGAGDIVTRVGKTDLPLVDSGLVQGRMLGAYLRQNNMIPDVIYTSALKRTQQTAAQAQAEMGTNLQMLPLVIFNEIDYGPDENRAEEDVVVRLGVAALKAWDTDAIVPQGWHVDPALIISNWKDFAQSVLKDYAGQTVLVVTSNGIARFAPHLTGDFKSFRRAHDIKISTGALCLFENDGSSAVWTCAAWNLKPKEHISPL